MMLAKLIGCPITTQVARVRKPESTIGVRVKIVSFTLRRATIRSAQMATSESRPAVMKAPLMVRPASWIEIGAPEASGAT